MGLTASSTGLGALDAGLVIERRSAADRVVALAGNPNVGKSTVFNELTGLNQHTGNWPGKTVSSAQGVCSYGGIDYILVDLPGTYSLMAHSAEEEVARGFLCFGGADAVVVVCDATCLERNLNLVLQTIEITDRTVVCVNLMDEAKKKKIRIDLEKLEELLGVPVVGVSARSGKGLDRLMERVSAVAGGQERPAPAPVSYTRVLEEAVSLLAPAVESAADGRIPPRWTALRLLESDQALIHSISEYLGFDLTEHAQISSALAGAERVLAEYSLGREAIKDRIVSCLVVAAEEISRQCVFHEDAACHGRDRRLDRLLTSRRTGIPIMLLLLAAIFWLTITGANIPSALLADGLFWIQDRLSEAFFAVGAPAWLHGLLVLGIYRTLAWVVSVMLPPMAIFFPLFTLLEDFGYLPRIAFNLDHFFQKARACGKQALTMCMGFGCNAAGVVGCRIIDSPRERLIAIITNSLVPCNGRFPTLIAIITMFFASGLAGPLRSAVSTLMLTGVILLGVLMTFLVSGILSRTILKGMPSSFTLELPPYRRPQVGKVILRSLFDRTLFVLGRAAAVAAPAGMVIWLMANVTVGGSTLLSLCSGALDPFARLLGLDGVILLAFILGFPANEIVVPIIIMAYLSTGSLLELSNLSELHALLAGHGWTWATAVSTMLFCLMHWPCSTTCLTIYKETQSLKWTAVSFLVPTLIGMTACFLFTAAVRLFGLA